MTQVDFHLLASQGVERVRWLHACKLTEKIYRLGMKIVLRVGGAAQAEALDDLLWTFRQGSFIPHAIAAEGASEHDEVPVWIRQDFRSALMQPVLINLTDAFPPDPGHFSRIVEILDDDVERKQAGRERFAHYRRLGHDVTAREIESNQDHNATP